MLRPNTAEVKGIPNNAAATNASVDVLPKQFITSMKTLFDILDDKNTGYVRFTDIEKGWRDDGCKGLPRGVLDSLRKVTPANGLLSFERFCAGLKLCLLRNQAETTPIAMRTTPPIRSNKTKSNRRSKSPRATLTNATEMEQSTKSPTTAVAAAAAAAQQWCNNSNNPATATVHPRNHMLTSQRTLSLPQLSPDSSEPEAELSTANLQLYSSPEPPPKPPRAAAVLAANKNATMDKNSIRNALQNWQMGLLLNEMDANAKLEVPIAPYINRGSADGGSTSSTNFPKPPKKVKSSNATKSREPRRHTLQNGIDFNTLRRLKQYEEEREVLLMGLDAIEKTRDWYLQQIEQVHKKIRCLGHMGEHVYHWTEVQQERLNYQRQRILEVNRCLETLAASWDLPAHYNLAISNSSKNSNQLNNESSYYLSLRNENRPPQNQQNLLLNMFLPLRISQPQSSPSSISGGGLIDADIVY